MMENRLVETNIKKAKQALKEADAVLITAGAGMGVDSGLPDFRGKKGFWRAYPIAKKLGLNFQDLANPRMFQDKNFVKLAWAFYGHRLNLYRKTKPHEGFYLLKDFAEDKKGKYFVFTSNVDGQFQKAGYDEKRIVEIHGSIHFMQCTLPCSDDIWHTDNIEIKIDEEKFEALDPLPKCKHCQRIARPNILMFRDYEWVSERTEKQEFLFERWLEKMSYMGYRLVIVEIGAGKAVPTVRWTSERISSHFNAPLIRINPRDYDVPAGGISIPLGGLEGIKRLVS